MHSIDVIQRLVRELYSDFSNKERKSEIREELKKEWAEFGPRFMSQVLDKDEEDVNDLLNPKPEEKFSSTLKDRIEEFFDKELSFDEDELVSAELKGKRIFINYLGQTWERTKDNKQGKWLGLFTPTAGTIAKAPNPDVEETVVPPALPPRSLKDDIEAALKIKFPEPEDEDEEVLVGATTPDGKMVYINEKGGTYRRNKDGEIGKWKGIFSPYSRKVEPAPEPD
jgi:hypothetical protein